MQYVWCLVDPLLHFAYKTLTCGLNQTINEMYKMITHLIFSCWQLCSLISNTVPLIPGKSILACSWIPIPLRIILKEPSLYAPEQVTSYNSSMTKHYSTSFSYQKCQFIQIQDKKVFVLNLTCPWPCLSRSTTHMSRIGPRFVNLSISCTYDPFSSGSTLS